MTPLAGLIAESLRAEGPMSVHDYMALCIGHERYGYYATRDPLGPRGDFITATEVSQMFGELIGMWCADTWRRMGAPAPVRLVELGPGRGTLMADALRAAHKVAPEFRRALGVHLVETSPVLRAAQRARLAAAAPSWHAALAEVPVGPTLLVANEFFDALPIRQVERTCDGWRERMIVLAADGCGFRVTVGVPSVHGAALPTGAAADAPLGAVAEDCPAGSACAGEIGRRVAAEGGAALIIDYGYRASASGDTLQAVRHHRTTDPFANPGACDLTAHVDFAALARAAREAGARVHGPVDQGAFLMALGIDARAATLKTDAAPVVARAVDAALARLIGCEHMGTLFQVMALTHPGLAAPEGFGDGA